MYFFLLFLLSLDCLLYNLIVQLFHKFLTQNVLQPAFLPKRFISPLPVQLVWLMNNSLGLTIPFKISQPLISH